MIFHEKLDLKFNIDAMREEVTSLENLGARIGQGASGEFGGWTLQSQDGDWRSGFEQGGYYKSADGSMAQIGQTPPIYEYNQKTDACVGIFADIIDELEEKGFYPHRSRITVLDPGQATSWHTDSPEGYYSVRIHIPFITNSDCAFEVRDEGSVHMAADGHAYLADVSTFHRAYNRGNTTRMHFLAQVWPTKHSEKFIVTESQQSILSFYAMTGYRVYQKVLDEKTKG